MSLILAQRDIDFLLYQWLKVEELTQRERFADHSRETFDAAMATSSQIAQDHFYPINKLLDTDEPHFDGIKVTTPEPLKAALKQFIDAGLMAAGQDFDAGGMQLPHVLEKACFAWFSGASAAASGYPMLTIGNANLLQRYGTPEQQRLFVKPMLAGRFFGTMCLSEPQAGSSLGDIRTRAVLQADGTYRLYGNKMWISAGEHELTENIVHLVLAKITAEGEAVPQGVKSISLFLVPKKLLDEQGNPSQRNDVVLAGLNHKMGYRGTTNCLLNFGEGQFTPDGKAGAVGTLVGQVNQGLACMFHMMNEARIGVGLGAVTLGYAGYLHSLEYARNRPQGRAPSAKDPNSAQQAIIEHADVRRMLLAQKSYVEGGLALELYCARLVDEWQTAASPEARDDAFDLLDLLTPIAKSWPSQWCLEANNLAIQVHGGYGYTRDYNVEQYYRDNRLNPIHEGTHGIQGLDLLGRKVRMKGGKALAQLQTLINLTIQLGLTHAELKSHAQALAHWGQELSATLVALGKAPSVDVGLANASVFLEAFGHYVVAWLWLEQALVAQTAMQASKLSNTQPLAKSEQDFYSGKLAAAKYFEKWELPKLGPMLLLLAQLEDTPLTMQDAWF
jgi:alkylation response protein AidB-like acyl-CoA dehydrogenase